MTAKDALKAAEAAWRTEPLVGEWSTAPGAAIVAAQIAGCLLAREGTEAEKKALAAIKAGARAKARATQFNTCEQENPQEEGGPGGQGHEYRVEHDDAGAGVALGRKRPRDLVPTLPQ